MRSLSVDATIAAQADAVWALLATPARWPEWGPSVRAVTCADVDAPVQVGTRGRVRTALWAAPYAIVCRRALVRIAARLAAANE